MHRVSDENKTGQAKNEQAVVDYSLTRLHAASICMKWWHRMSDIERAYMERLAWDTSAAPESYGRALAEILARYQGGEHV